MHSPTTRTRFDIPYLHCKRQIFIMKNILRDIVLPHLLSCKYNKQSNLMKADIGILGFTFHISEYTWFSSYTGFVMFCLTWFLNISEICFYYTFWKINSPPIFKTMHVQSLKPKFIFSHSGSFICWTFSIVL